ncbi:hypothetical protein CEP54_014437 [Fusarium duplospermum]|uniref:Uncharacterized protein n=1 Tax=Fusarium duplospermum TaxID=1325734 RepID=A0A428NW62_9HYPO|nr:hypothetical protein CEP54_014437 [Fusarium duplospermum]
MVDQEIAPEAVSFPGSQAAERGALQDVSGGLLLQQTEVWIQVCTLDQLPRSGAFWLCLQSPPQVFAMLAVAVYTLGAVMAAVVEDWHVRACHVHWKLFQRSPYSTPKPLHDALGLDATSEPFYPQSFSSSPGKQWHHRVLKAILTATAAHTSADLDWVARQLPSRDASLTATDNLGIKDDHVLTLMEIGSLLSDDHARGNYAQLFVPALTKKKPTDDEKLRQSRIKALEQLCA